MFLTAVNRLQSLTPPFSDNSTSWRADRRSDPTPNDQCSGPPSTRPVQNARRNCQKPPTILDGCLIAPTHSPKTSNGTNSVAIVEEERQPRFQKDPIWRDSLLSYECLHVETGEGLGASHQRDGRPSLERSWRTALAPRPSGRAKRQSAKLARCVLSRVWMLPPFEVLFFKHAQVAKPFWPEILIDPALDLAMRRASGRTGH